MTPERRERLLTVLQKRQTNLTVVLEDVQDPHNVAAVMRTCDAVGIQDLYIITTLAPRRKKWGHRSSSSAEGWLTIHQFTDPEACVAELRKKYNKIYTTHLATDSVTLYDIDFTDSVALVFGNERTGVSDKVRALADGNFIIPQMGMIRSLNISVACAVSIYEAMRQKSLAGHYDKPSLAPERYNALLEEWGFRGEELNEELL
ncbi:tRNA (guanosine-2'-O-)-methyltransferase [Chitinophaga terrae (ex Kim and Jung 2007)]|uniref:tRNA (guanosine(18)-2'-O)-methyltransferase n=1 Tax=Chitinophaga terrae (ex Kim and Jung 2007) TaxID=408074 RepID=A0A1H4FUY2_9BACT|nr:RNA methyltransferase [Chitinophaga terrae (ex Kim and Jung 2007)]MDQ0108222.1 tRNA (guanosine-2'-O-)-methyltransferase [Chitinophaga terrae (ex Kim and Jung 2007)]GEP92809.1 tRNA (guanosine(18)-2'-O)-methyltransferase [Chitinophaga terrae (ex Kim and Jung 2007)]SEB01159.1 tRNA (guanosine-2'-O-)-methyltransferase [Chitinophaga terrae (ex Kim and Jung 2007)]